MIALGTVSSTVKPDKVKIDEFSVWVAENIAEKSVTDQEMGTEHIAYEYDLIQYGKDEYLNLLIEDNTAFTGQITDLQTALVEVYELVAF